MAEPAPAPGAQPPSGVRAFTLQQLARFDGKDGRLAYIAYQGKVYDVSASAFWESGEHQGDHLAGRDLTTDMRGSPHGEETLKGFPVVGELR